MADADFGVDDLELLVALVESNDSMLSTAHAVRTVERQAGYPIKDLDALVGIVKGLADPGGEVSIGLRTVSVDQVGIYVSPDGFPIESRQDLIGVLLASFERERTEVFERLEIEQQSRLRGTEGADVDEPRP